MTEQQARLFAFIKSFVACRGYSPSYDDMRLQMGFASKSGISRLVTGLVEAGKVTRRPFRARGIELAQPKTCPHCGGDLDGGMDGGKEAAVVGV